MLFKPRTMITLMASAWLAVPFSLAHSAPDAISGASEHTGTGHAQQGNFQFSPDMLFAADSRSLKIAQELDLTPEQQDRIKLAIYELEPRFKQIIANAHSLRDKLNAAKPDDPNFALLTAEASQLAADTAAAAVTLNAETHARLAGILTDAQRDTLKAKIEEKRAEHKAKMEAKKAAEISG